MIHLKQKNRNATENAGGNKMRKIISGVILGIIIILTALYIYGPIAFMPDGMLTRQKVTSFDNQYDLGSTRRHNYESDRMYVVYLGKQPPEIQEEILYREDGDVKKKVSPVKMKTVIPGIYSFKWNKEVSVYRCTGREKYYFTIVVT